jgi:dTDP-glucose 4,6-dehydratase
LSSVSTDEVYGDLKPDTFATESAPLQPSSPYSASKAGSDLPMRSFVRTFNFPAVITRASNNYGPFQFPEKFLFVMITNALRDKQLPIYGDGKQERDWLHVEDHGSGILAVLENGRTGEVDNIGGADISTNFEMACRVLRVVGKPDTLLSFVRDRPGHDRRYALACDKIKVELGWPPKKAPGDGLKETINWYRTNAQWLGGVRDGQYMSYYEKYYVNRESSLRGLIHSRAGSVRSSSGAGERLD